MAINNHHETVFDTYRERYLEILKPIFLPADPASKDIIRYFACLLRVLGMEDKGWDPYTESFNTLNDINNLMRTKFAKRKFPDPHKTIWHLGLTFYSHIVEMDVPYEVITNLLRFQMGRGYSPNPFFYFLTEKEKKNFSRLGIRTKRKIDIIKILSKETGHTVGKVYDEFYNSSLRNAVQHSDYILGEDEFRCRSGISGNKAFTMTYEALDLTITKAKAFISAFFQIETITRQVWGKHKGTALQYDPIYKGLLEILVDERSLMCGFTVHWPNNTQSTYRRSDKGIEMVNCFVDLKHATIALHVGHYAINRGSFSPLVERDNEPVYTPLDKTTIRLCGRLSLILKFNLNINLSDLEVR